MMEFNPRTSSAVLALLWLVALLLCDHPSQAFVRNPNPIRPALLLAPQQFSSSSSRTRLWAVPVLDRWKVLPSGSIIGTVRGHPAIEDGDVITTSPIVDRDSAKAQFVVKTASGSEYRLLTPLRAQPQNPSFTNNAAAAAAFAFNGFSNDSSEDNVNGGISNANGDNSSSNEGSYTKLRSGPAWKAAVLAYKLSQSYIGLDEEYLLAGKPVRSTSGKSYIWDAYRADVATGGLPKEGEPPVCIKVSTNLEAVSREYENYRKLNFLGISRGRFVHCHEFFPVAGYDKRFRNQCALVLEKGSQDLKSFLNSRGRLDGKDLRDACIAAAQCVQALHNVGLVWTDLKTENFVVMNDGEVKGIDLESAMPVGDNPVDYSPEACPPEFAAAFLEGDGPYFQLETSYDIWSLGMLMLELSTGGGYFDGKTPAQITKWLRDSEEGIPVDDYDMDDRLKDLLRRCLQKDAKKRPNMAQILLHPYFITSPLSIFQNFS
jgi:hypothetical protein